MTRPVRWETRSWDALDRDTLYALIGLREAVFVVEQDCPYLDADGRDPLAHHLIGWDGDTAVATLRLFGPDVVRPGEVVFGRVVTAATHRRQGLGRELMERGLAEGERLFGPYPVWLSGQAYLQGFYESLGFVVDGPGYLEDDIPHLPMRRPVPR